MSQNNNQHNDTAENFINTCTAFRDTYYPMEGTKDPAFWCGTGARILVDLLKQRGLTFTKMRTYYGEVERLHRASAKHARNDAITDEHRMRLDLLVAKASFDEKRGNVHVPIAFVYFLASNINICELKTYADLTRFKRHFEAMVAFGKGTLLTN